MSGTVVVGGDGSEASKAAVGWAARQAEFLGATLVAVNSWGPIYPVGVEPEEKARQELTKVLVQILGTDRAAAVRLVLSPDAPWAPVGARSCRCRRARRRQPRSRPRSLDPHQCAARIGERVLHSSCQVPGRGHPGGPARLRCLPLHQARAAPGINPLGAARWRNVWSGAPGSLVGSFVRLFANRRETGCATYLSGSLVREV